MAITSVASRKRWQQATRWLLDRARAALAWAFIGATVPLPLERLSQMSAAQQALLIAAFVLCIGAAVGLMLPPADAIRDRAEP